ncbi:MAG: tRNA (cytidine(34)-2'-O)-methyltransferase [Alphaproteobacteria bacterium]
MRIAFFQPDIAQNAGTIIRLGACVNIGVDIIEPCGFMFNEKALKRAGMDYIEQCDYKKHISWDAFLEHKEANPEEYGRIILLTTKASVNYTKFEFKENDVLLLGRESKGVPQEVHDIVDGRVIIPMTEHARSLNVAISGAMVLSEALRQINQI